ncbi:MULTISPECIES: hypothetical protein [unclassified Francisella]|nr:MULTISPECIES: hypothetical protein [unclassified Francisella]MED7818326.1 hypothetical protein [Francisella sp. 19S2-4]MED7829162.1 hypothetical protein [Francisella sp. 19S2-10]
MKKVILTTVVVWSLVSTGLSYGIQGEVSSESFPSPVMELTS